MALVFSVSAPTIIFSEPHATNVTNTLQAQFGDSIAYGSTVERCSCELGWSGWSLLQERASKACGSEAIPHFLSMEAWCGVFLPVDTPTGTFEFSDNETNLEVGCLKKVISELELIGASLNLPTDDAELASLYRKYADDDDLIDDDMDIQTFTQLLPLARFALAHQLPLWIVK